MKIFRRIKNLIIFVCVLVTFFVVVNVIPPSKVMDTNPFISTSGLPMLCAHRGGKTANPENTLKAYRAAANEFKVDIMESDLWLTKDNQLVYNHDDTINRTSDVVQITGEDKDHYVSDYTLEELRNFNFGYNFEDKNGNYPYRNIEGLNGENRKQILKDNGLSIVEVSELFEEFYETNPDLLFIVEIKDSGERGYTAATILDDLLTKKYPNYKNQLVVGTFHDEIEADLKENHPTLLRGAPTGTAAKFIITEMFKVNLFDNDKFACLQIPTSYDIKGININLNKEKYITRAHKRNIAVQYWTINEEEEMKELIELGCDAIMTDDPGLLRDVLNSYKK